MNRGHHSKYFFYILVILWFEMGLQMIQNSNTQNIILMHYC
jgi:hypothetical protein